MVILAIMAAFVGAAQAEDPSPIVSPGIAAYADIGSVIDLDDVKSAFLMVEYETEDYIVGTLDLPGYETIYNPLVLVQSDGLIMAFYPDTDPAGKLVDVISKNLDETLLEKAVEIVAAKAGVVPASISHYDFRILDPDPDADKMLLVAEYEPDGNAFTLQLDDDNTYYEKSYAFYRTFAPSFTLDNDSMDQVDFVETNADYIGAGYYGTIYGDFSVIDFDPGVEYTFAVEAGDHLGFGALAILYSGVAPTVNDADFLRPIDLDPPGIDPVLVFDLTPSAFFKTSPGDEETNVVLNPTLSWGDSSAPNYEYCIDTSDNSACDTSWISTGSSTSVVLSNLYYETDYYWQVRAINSYDVVYANGGTWWSFATPTGVAPNPFDKDEELTKLIERIDSLSKVTMTWEESYGAYHYEVCVDTTADCIAPELWHNVGLATSATIGDLLLDKTYFVQVRAVNDYGVVEADGGTWWSFTTRTFSKLRPLQDVVYNVTLPFMWEETPIATNGYQYCIDTSAPDDDSGTDDCNTEWKKANGTSVAVKLKVADTYYWQVRAVNGDDVLEANGGEWWEFDVLSRKDLRKINLFKVSPLDGAVDQAISSLKLSWKATRTATSYEYCFFPVYTTPISDDDTCTYDEDNWVPVGTAISATIDDLSNVTTYYWQVRANIGTDDEPDWLYADKGDYWAFTTLP